MKYFALAVIAAAVSALDAEHGSGWSYQQPTTSSYHSRPSHSSHHSSGYGQSRSGHHAPVHTQTAGYTSNAQFSAHAAPRASYGNNYYHQPNHAHNPFEYSRPQIPYVAAKLHAPVYATCTATGGSGHSYTLRFG